MYAKSIENFQVSLNPSSQVLHTQTADRTWNSSQYHACTWVYKQSGTGSSANTARQRAIKQINDWEFTLDQNANGKRRHNTSTHWENCVRNDDRFLEWCLGEVLTVDWWGKTENEEASDVRKDDCVVAVLDFGDGSASPADNKADAHTKVGSKGVTKYAATNIIDFEQIIQDDGIERVSNHLKNNNDKFLKEPNSTKYNPKHHIHHSTRVSSKRIILLPDINRPLITIGPIPIKQFLPQQYSFPHWSKQEVNLNGYNIIEPVVDHAHVHVGMDESVEVAHSDCYHDD